MKDIPTILITGAGRGLGRALAERFYGEGWRVCLADVDQTVLADWQGDAERSFTTALDVRHQSSVDRCVTEIEQRFGRLDCVINNAGIFSLKPMTELEDAEFLDLIDVNLVGVFRTCRTASRALLKASQGQIINIASVAAHKGAPQAGHYAASKAAVVALSKSLALELAADGIRVNVVSPGYLDTPMMDPYRNVMRGVAAMRIPARRLGESEEIADAIYRFATIPTPYLNGAELIIDGGFTIN